MVEFLLRCLARFLLWLRYRVRVRGLEEVAARGTRGIIFLPNHPALIDPIILVTLLHKRFRPRAVGDQDQIDRFFIRWLARRIGVLPMPSIALYGRQVREAIGRALAEAARLVNCGDNFVFYPAGHLKHSCVEDLRGNSGVETLLRGTPGARVVLVRMRGLWGSSFSWAKGRPPSVGQTLRKGALGVLLSGLFFAPRRDVTIEFAEPEDFPRGASRDELNRYLEEFYNADADRNSYVPYTIWERSGRVELPEPDATRFSGDLRSVPRTTRETVLKHLAELAGRAEIRDDEHLARDLGLDSLARTELLAWVEAEFGYPQGDADAVQTVSDVLLAACGEVATSEFAHLAPVPARWFDEVPGNPRVRPSEAATITEMFLGQARRAPGRLIIADQARGARSYRDIVLAVLVLKPELEKLEGERLGIMLPASVAAGVTFLAALFSGKTPVMVNWTLGARGVLQSLDLVGVRRILTARALVTRLQAQGSDFSSLKDRFVYLEDLAKGIGAIARLKAFLKSRLSWRSLDGARASQTAVVLFTSGSEAAPKAVPLTHANMLENLRGVFQLLPLSENERLVGFPPPFHAFGITITMLPALCFGLRTVYHPNPTEGAVLARLIEAYRVTVLTATPTFLRGILRSAVPGELASLRLAITGAEKCPEQVYDGFAQRCPRATLMEAYGTTECSPLITLNEPHAPKRGAIGKLLPALERLLVDPETGRLLEPPATGLLLVRGPSVFAGYLNYDGPSPFVEIAGRTWYRTGDIVSEDADGVLTFRGRLKRFVKRGGEMISLPAIESLLKDQFTEPSTSLGPGPAEDAPTLAVEATASEADPELVLFTTKELEREAVNRRLRDAGLSPLHNIRRVVRLDSIPVLGTGKTDYRALKSLLADK